MAAHSPEARDGAHREYDQARTANLPCGQPPRLLQACRLRPHRLPGAQHRIQAECGQQDASSRLFSNFAGKCVRTRTAVTARNCGVRVQSPIASGWGVPSSCWESSLLKSFAHRTLEAYGVLEVRTHSYGHNLSFVYMRNAYVLYVRDRSSLRTSIAEQEKRENPHPNPLHACMHACTADRGKGGIHSLFLFSDSRSETT